MSKELTAEKFNKVIINLRKVVRIAAVRVAQKLTSQIERLKKGANEKKKRRINRYLNEIKALNKLKVKCDEVSKFALVNVKSFNEIKITNETLPFTVVLYKTATSPTVLKAVGEVRKTYPNWHQEIPFILQRFGKQSKAKKTKQFKKDQSKKSRSIAAADESDINEEMENIESNDDEDNLKKSKEFEFEFESKHNKELEDNKNVNKLENKDEDDISVDKKDNAKEKKNSNEGEDSEEDVFFKKPSVNFSAAEKPLLNLKAKGGFSKLSKTSLASGKNEERQIRLSYGPGKALLGKKQKVLKGSASNEGKLHPSWEAAKLKKERLQATISAAINGVQPTCKHIKFDSDEN